MSPSRRRARRRRPRAAGTAPPPADQPAGQRARGTEWRWRTFPVYFAFSLGLFLGVYGGAIGVWAETEGNGSVFLVVSIIASIFLGFGLSRLVVRFMVGRNWIRQRSRRKKRG